MDEAAPHRLQKRTFAQLLDYLRQCGDRMRPVSAAGSFGEFHLRARPGGGVRVYALGVIGASKHHALVYADVDTSLTDAAVVWRPLLQTSDHIGQGAPSKEEELLRERMRSSVFSGVTSFSVDNASGAVLFVAASRLYVCSDAAFDESVSPSPLPLSIDVVPIDVQSCPTDPSVLAIASGGEIYTHSDGRTQRATFATADAERRRTAGSASFIIQEEFDRYKAMWWRPATQQPDDAAYLLYEEVDETEVRRVSVVSPASPVVAADAMCYPLAGTANATSTLKLLHVQKDGGPTNLSLGCSMRDLVPDAEYLVRAGWTADGAAAWAQLLSRDQQRIYLLRLPLECFLQPSSQLPDLRVQLLYHEAMQTYFNVTDDIYMIMPTSPNELQFIWASERSGFEQLLLITAQLDKTSTAPNSSLAVSCCATTAVELTPPGNPIVRRESRVVVDEARALVYFIGFDVDALESHVYVASLHDAGSVRCLTAAGKSHAPRLFTLNLDVESGAFVCWENSLSQPRVCVVYAVDADERLPTARRVCTIAPPRPIFDVDSDLLAAPVTLPPAELFSYKSETSGFTHFGALIRPADWRPNVQYPVIQFVYGGPQVQLVQNAYSTTQALGYAHKVLPLGYALLVVDGRGSDGRGHAFESAIRHKMGTIEVADQVEGLQFAARHFGCLDESRVAIFGWSYGGYLALLGLAQRPDVYSAAVAGGPVTCWSLYDTGYTERYMGQPAEQPDAYERGSVLARAASCLPDEPGRLLILHGLIDENVHFQHTEKLIGQLLQGGKPYQLQLYPNERHGVRSSEARDHMDATLLFFLQDRLA